MTRTRHAGLVMLLVGGSLAVVLASVGSNTFDLERYLVPKELALHLTALAGLGLLLASRTGWRAGIVEVLFGVALVWAALSTLVAANRWLAVRSLGIGLSALIVLALARSVGAGGGRRTALYGLAGAVVAGALTGLAQAYGVEWGTPGTRAPGGTFGNRNFLAHVAALGMPVLLFLALSTRRRSTRAGLLLALAATVAAIILTRSRAAWLAGGAALAAGAALTLLRARAWRASLRARRWLAAGLAIGLGLLAAVGLPNRLDWRSDSPYRDSLRGLTNYREGSGRGRIVQYRNSLTLAARHSGFGVGPGNWFVHYPTVTTPGDPSYAGYDPLPTNPWPSSDWIAFLTELGMPGTLALLLAGLAAGLIAWRRTASGSAETEGQAVTLIAVLIAVLVAGAFDAVVHLAAPAFLAAGFLGLLLPETRAVVEVRPGGFSRRAAGVTSVTLVASLVVSSIGQVTAIRLAPREASRPDLLAAVRLDPGSHRIHLRLAQRGTCRERLPHARAAGRLLPFHPVPRQILDRCGAASVGPRPPHSAEGSGTWTVLPTGSHRVHRGTGVFSSGRG